MKIVETTPKPKQRTFALDINEEELVKLKAVCRFYKTYSSTNDIKDISFSTSLMSLILDIELGEEK